MPKIYLYAEVLTHLRQLTLHASLETEKNQDTKIEISSNKRVITVIHDGESSSLYLPTQISGTAQVTFPYDKKTELSARVQIEDLEQWQETDAAGIEAPWNASELSFETSMKCRECNSEILPMGTVSSWKDLPNQNWADVMDLWFCHKPHEHQNERQEQQAAEAKGFSAQSRIASKPGIGMVSLISFVMHPDDCSNLQIAEINNGNALKPTPLQCAQCQVQVGSFAPSENLVRLYKACMNVRTLQKEDFVCFPTTTFTSAELLELIESTAIRKVIAYYASAVTTATTAENEKDTSVGFAGTHNKGTHESPESQAAENVEEESRPTDELTEQSLQLQPCLLWIFNPDIYYSSSRLTTETKTNTTLDLLRNLSVSSTGTDTTASPSTATNNPTQPTSTPLTEADPQANQPTNFSTSITLPHRAMKIFYRNLTPSEISTLLPSPSTTTTTTTTVSTSTTSTPSPNPNSSTPPLSPNTIEYLPISNPTHLHALHSTLSKSTEMLPQSARTFQDFSVGLLDRYERHPTAEKVMENNPLARKLNGGDEEDLGMDGRPRVTRWEMPAGAHELYL